MAWIHASWIRAWRGATRCTNIARKLAQRRRRWPNFRPCWAISWRLIAGDPATGTAQEVRHRGQATHSRGDQFAFVGRSIRLQKANWRTNCGKLRRQNSSRRRRVTCHTRATATRLSPRKFGHLVWSLIRPYNFAINTNPEWNFHPHSIDLFPEYTSC